MFGRGESTSSAIHFVPSASVAVCVPLSTKRSDKLLTENAGVRNLLLRTSGGDELANRLCRLVADVFWNSTAEREERAGEAGVKEKECVLTADALCINLDLLHIHCRVEESV